MSINSFNSLPSILPSGTSEVLGGAKAATTGTNATPNGQEFSVYFERMMHPAFSQTAASGSDPTFSNSLSQSSFSAQNKPKDSNPSVLSSSLLDPHSSTLAFSHDYLKTKASVADLKLNIPRSNATERRQNISRENNTKETSIVSKKRDNPTVRTHSADPSESSSRTSSPSTLERLQKRVDDSQGDAQGDAGNQSSSDSNIAEQEKTSLTPSNLDTQGTPIADVHASHENLTQEQKLALAQIQLAEQRLPALGDPSATEASNGADAIDALQASAADVTDSTSNLRTVALGEQTQIITTQSSPNEKSLADFARAMGFDESQIASLFGPHAAQTLVSMANTQEISSNPTSLSATPKGAGASSKTLTAAIDNSSMMSVINHAAASIDTYANPVSQLTSASDNPSLLNVLTHSDPSIGTSVNPLSKLPSSTIGIQPPLVIDASLQAALSTLSTQNALASSSRSANSNSVTASLVPNSATLTSAENLAQLLNAEGVEPQSVQLNISGGLKNAAFPQANMPGAGNPGQAPTSTLAVLSMTGSQLSDHAISALHKEFNLLKAQDSSSAFSVNSSQDSSLLSVAQLNASDAGGNSSGADAGNGSGGSQAPNTQAANSGSAVNMAETYEKLSNQLTAELSKRMHEQISQGQWKMKFALKPNTLGTVDVQLEMKDGKLAAVFQADNALTQNLLQHSSQQLKDNLKEFGLEQTFVQVDQQSAGQSQQNDQQNNGKNPFEPLNETLSIAAAQDSTPVVDASMKVKNNDSLLDLMA